MPRGILIGALALVGAGLTAPQTLSETDRLVAAARLYGVARWFHPSDAAAELDWDGMAVLTVQRARQAEDTDGLAKALETLYAPVVVGLAVGGPPSQTQPRTHEAGPIVAYRHLGLGVRGSGTYFSGRTGR